MLAATTMRPACQHTHFDQSPHPRSSLHESISIMLSLSSHPSARSTVSQLLHDSRATIQAPPHPATRARGHNQMKQSNLMLSTSVNTSCSRPCISAPHLCGTAHLLHPVPHRRKAMHARKRKAMHARLCGVLWRRPNQGEYSE